MKKAAQFPVLSSQILAAINNMDTHFLSLITLTHTHLHGKKTHICEQAIFSYLRYKNVCISEPNYLLKMCYFVYLRSGFCQDLISAKVKEKCFILMSVWLHKLELL